MQTAVKRRGNPPSTHPELLVFTVARSQPGALGQAWLAFSSPLGWIAWHQTAHGLKHLRFGYQRLAALTAELSAATHPKEVLPDSLARQAHELLAALATGSRVDLGSLPVDLSGQPPFRARVLRECRAIPSGQLISYSELAVRAGSPGAARAVGSAMAHNPVPLVIPCHRVVASGGRLGGFSAPGGLTTKALLLRMEGHAIAEAGP